MSRTRVPPFTLVVEPGPGEVVVVLSGELDLATAEVVERKVRDLRRSGIERVVLDLRGLTLVDSTGLGTLLLLRNDAERDGHELTLVRGPREVQRVFALTVTAGLFRWRDG